MASTILRQHSDTSLQDMLTLFCSELDDRAYWTEYLFPHNLHIRLAFCENSRLNEVTLFPMAFSADVNGCAVLFTGLDVSHDPLIEGEQMPLLT